MHLLRLLVQSSAFHCGSVVKRMAVGYAPDGSAAPLQDLGWLRPAGQMYSTVDDLAKVGRMRFKSVCSSVCPPGVLALYYIYCMLSVQWLVHVQGCSITCSQCLYSLAISLCLPITTQPQHHQCSRKRPLEKCCFHV